MAMAAMTKALTNGMMNQQQSPGTPATPGTPQRQQQPVQDDPLMALIKKHLMGAPPPPAAIQPKLQANPGYDESSGGTA